MRGALWGMVLVALALSVSLGSSAFNYATTARAVQVVVAGDAAAYLGIAAMSDSPHRCFVDTADGKLSITFDTPSTGCGAGTGTGINAGDGSTSGKYSRYAFHDILQLTNKGQTTLFLWVNATTDTGSESALDVALEPSAGQMTDAKYSTAEALTGWTIGSNAYVGVRVKSGMLSSGSVTGTLSVEARE